MDYLEEKKYPLILITYLIIWTNLDHFFSKSIGIKGFILIRGGYHSY